METIRRPNTLHAPPPKGRWRRRHSPWSGLQRRSRTAALVLTLAALAWLGRHALPAGADADPHGSWWPTRHGQAEAGCDVLARPCSAMAAGSGQAVLRLRQTEPGGQVDVSLTLAGLEPRSVRIDLNGQTMDMGPNRSELRRDSDGLWHARTALSACLSGPMAWVATVTVDERWQRQVLRYRFETGTAPAR